MTTIPIINSSETTSYFDNRYSIYVADPYQYQEPDFSLIQKLAEDLGAINPVLIRRENLPYNYSYLTADKFLSVQSQLEKAFTKNQFQVEEKIDEKELLTS